MIFVLAMPSLLAVWPIIDFLLERLYGTKRAKASSFGRLLLKFFRLEMVETEERAVYAIEIKKKAC